LIRKYKSEFEGFQTPKPFRPFKINGVTARNFRA
jgi:hypothetical protein